MSSSKHKDWILETIDQLRKRKARPDLERICHMVQRKHGLSLQEIRADLEHLVSDGVVYKVDYKGNTSYRNASKWRKTQGEGQNVKSMEPGQKILFAVQTLCESGEINPSHHLTAAEQRAEAGSPTSDDRREGVSAKEVEEWLNIQDPDSPLSEDTIVDRIDREIEMGNMKKLPSGNVCVIGRAKTPKGKSERTPGKPKIPRAENQAATVGDGGSPGAPHVLTELSVDVTSSPGAAEQVVTPPLSGHRHQGNAVTPKLTSPGSRKGRAVNKRKVRGFFV